MHINFYTYSYPCIFTSLCLYKLLPKPFRWQTEIHRQRYKDRDTQTEIHRQRYTDRDTQIEIQRQRYTDRDTQTEIHRQRIHTTHDRHVQIHRYDYRRYYMTEYRLYIITDCLVDSTLNSMIVESFVVVRTRIAKQYFTRLYCDRSK